MNLYAYVGNNSVMFVDRMGLSEKPVVEESTVSKIVSSFFDPNLLPINELEKLSQEADSFTVVRTTMLNPENQVGPKVHTEIIFFTGDDPIASLGSAMIFGWKLEKNQDVLDTYVEHGTLVGIRKSDVEGCVEGLEDSLSSSMWTLEGRATICWHGPISCYNNSENEYGKESNILVDQIMKYIIPGAH